MENLKDILKAVRETLEPNWLDNELERSAEMEARKRPVEFVRSLGEFLRWRETPDLGSLPLEDSELARFVQDCMTIWTATHLARSEEWRSELRSRAHSRDDSGFRDILFEAEVASFFSYQEGVRCVEFGRENQRPDLWIVLGKEEGASRVPISCKRIQPEGSHEREFRNLRREARQAIYGKLPSDQSARVRVWLHYNFSKRALRWLIPAVDDLVSRAREVPTRTETDHYRRGLAQVTVRLGEDASSEASHTVEIDTDCHWDRMGRLRESVAYAVSEQLASVATADRPGWIAIRIRPPKGVGDLYEADLICRGFLEDEANHHLEVIALFWDEFDEPENLDQERKRLEFRSRLRAYYCVANRSSLSDIDSFEKYFENESDAVYRNPITGEFQPISRLELSRSKKLDDLPSEIADAARGVESLSEDSGSATTYFKLRDPYPENVREGWISVTRAGDRQFRSYFRPEGVMTTFEWRNGGVIGVATTDLLAWEGRREFGYVISWTPAAFKVGIWSPDESRRVVARSVDA